MEGPGDGRGAVVGRAQGAWFFASVAVLAFWLLVLLADALYSLVSYMQPVDGYTGQDWHRAVSWVLLGVLLRAPSERAIVRLKTWRLSCANSAAALGASARSPSHPRPPSPRDRWMEMLSEAGDAFAGCWRRMLFSLPGAAMPLCDGVLDIGAAKVADPAART